LRSNFVWPGHAGLSVERRRAPETPLAKAFLDLASLARRYSFAVMVAPVPAARDPQGSMNVLTQWVPLHLLQPFSVVDVVPAVQRRLAAEHIAYQELFWQHDDHLNAVGNRVYALALAESFGLK
jgi:hypothetical protein